MKKFDRRLVTVLQKLLFPFFLILNHKKICSLNEHCSYSIQKVCNLVLFSFGKIKFEKFDFRTGPKKSSNYSDFTRRILVFCKSGLLQEAVTEGASTVYRLVV